MAKKGIAEHVAGHVYDRTLGGVSEETESHTSDGSGGEEVQTEEEARWAKTRRSLKTKFKILLGVYQVQDALPWTLPTVSFPKAFEALVTWMSFLELNIVQVLPLSCLRPFSYFDRLLAMTVVPLAFAVLIFGIGKIAIKCAGAERRSLARTHTFGWFLLLTFIVFPSVSTTVLRFFQCVSYDKGMADGSTEVLKVLEADHDISCESPSYHAWKAYAAVMLFVYPIGVPVLYWTLLFRHREQINPEVNDSPLGEIEEPDEGRPRSPSAEAYLRISERFSFTRQNSSARDLMKSVLGLNKLSQEEIQRHKLAVRNADDSIHHLLFLFEEYEPRCYQFVVFECARKLALTGLLIFVYAGSASQIGIGLLIAILSDKYYTHVRPYIEDTDDNLANVGNTQIILVFIASLMLFIKEMDEQSGAPGDLFRGPIFTCVMIIIGTLVLLATLYAILVETCEVDIKKASEDVSVALASAHGRARVFTNSVPDQAVEVERDEEAIGTEDASNVASDDVQASRLTNLLNMFAQNPGAEQAPAAPAPAPAALPPRGEPLAARPSIVGGTSLSNLFSASEAEDPQLEGLASAETETLGDIHLLANYEREDTDSAIVPSPH